MIKKKNDVLLIFGITDSYVDTIVNELVGLKRHNKMFWNNADYYEHYKEWGEGEKVWYQIIENLGLAFNNNEVSMIQNRRNILSFAWTEKVNDFKKATIQKPIEVNRKICGVMTFEY